MAEPTRETTSMAAGMDETNLAISIPSSLRVLPAKGMPPASPSEQLSRRVGWVDQCMVDPTNPGVDWRSHIHRAGSTGTLFHLLHTRSRGSASSMSLLKQGHLGPFCTFELLASPMENSGPISRQPSRQDELASSCRARTNPILQ